MTDWAWEKAAAFIVPIVGAIGWLFRLEGRVSNNTKDIADMKDDVHYIRNRLDAVYQNCFKHFERDRRD